MFIVDKNGDITLRQGDSGRLNIVGLPTDQNYTVFFAIQDENRKPFGSEISVNTNKSDKVTIVITAELTDLLVVPKTENSKEYYYGIKLCTEAGDEDTSIIGSSDITAYNTITVLPKKVEGLL